MLQFKEWLKLREAQKYGPEVYQQVLNLARQEPFLNNAQIAAQTNLSLNTVKFMLQNLTPEEKVSRAKAGKADVTERRNASIRSYPPEVYQQIITLGKQHEPFLYNAQIATQLSVSVDVVKNVLRAKLSPEEQAYRSQVQLTTKRDQTGAAAKQRWNDPAYQEKMKNAHQQQWTNPEYREKMTKLGQVRGVELGAGSQERWNDPAFREKMANIHQSPAHREKLRTNYQQLITDPEYREKMARVAQQLGALGKEQWNDPAYREKMMNIFQSPEHRAKMPMWNDYWKWLATFPLEKRRQIIVAQMRGNDNYETEDRERMISAMLAKAATLGNTPP